MKKVNNALPFIAPIFISSKKIPSSYLLDSKQLSVFRLKQILGTKFTPPKRGSPINLSEMNLVGEDLRYIVLEDANLSGSDLSGANLSGANLKGANLVGATIAFVDFDGADLRYANLDQVMADLETAKNIAVAEKSELKYCLSSDQKTSVMAGVPIFMTKMLVNFIETGESPKFDTGEVALYQFLGTMKNYEKRGLL